MTGGLLLLAAALCLTAFNIWDEKRAAKEAEGALAVLSQVIQEEEADRAPVNQSASLEDIPDYILNPSMDMPEIEIDGERYIGILEIPALGVSLPIMGTLSYPNLRIAPCRYTGTVYENNMVIAGHNYTAHFGGLKSLKQGDKVTFTDSDGNIFSYSVAELHVLEPTAIEEMQAGDWDLTLFTCTIGGAARVTVRCVEDSAGQ